MDKRWLARTAIVSVSALSMISSMTAAAGPAGQCGTPVLAELPTYSPGSSVTLVWTSEEMQSSSFIVQVAEDPSFANSVSYGKVLGSPYTVAGLGETTYYFRVKAKTFAHGRCLSTSFSNVVSTTLDASAPVVSGAFSRPPDANGWFNSPVSAVWTGTDVGSGIAGCSADSVYSGPDSMAEILTGSCTDHAGNVGHASLTLAFDASAPSITAAASRLPDSNGWYNHGFSVSWTGTDEMSGIGLCDPSSVYDQPDTAAGLVSGSCSDLAGNSGTASWSFQFDATGPSTTINLTSLPLVVGPLGDTVSGSAADNLSGVSGTLVTFTDLLGTITIVEAVCLCVGDSYTWTASTEGLLPGIYTVAAGSTDVAGNAGPATTPVTLIVL